MKNGLFVGISWLALSGLFQSAMGAEIYAGTGSRSGIFHLKGDIKPGDEHKLLRAIGSQRGGVITLESPGGALVSGLAIGNVLRQRNFTTAVAEGAICASSCGLIWLGGTRRYLHPQGRVGFHAASLKGSETGAGNALVGAYLNNLGLPYTAVVYVTVAPPNKILWLTQADARKIKIAFTASDPPASSERVRTAAKTKERAVETNSPTSPVEPKPRTEAKNPESAELPVLKREIFVTKGGRVRAHFFYNLRPDCAPVGKVAGRIVTEPRFGRLDFVHEPGFTEYPKHDERNRCNSQSSEVMTVYYNAAEVVEEDAYVVQAFFPNGRTRRVEVSVHIR